MPATTFIATCIVVCLAAFLNYKQRGLVRHPEDIKLFALEHTHGTFRRLILSDSITENATAGISLDSADLPLMTHGWMRLAGQFFLMRRALEQAQIQAVDFFLTPDLLLATVDEEANGRIRHTYTDTLFTRSDEIADLHRSGDRKAGERLVLFELMYKSLQPGARELAERTAKHTYVGRPADTGETNVEGRQHLVDRAKAFSHFEIPSQNLYFLKRFTETCTLRKLKCRFVIEPLPTSVPHLDFSELRKFIRGVELVDVNDFASFPDSAFHDGLHLRSPDWTSFYRTLLSEHDLMSFGSVIPKALPWIGGEIRMRAGQADSRIILTAGFYAPESWGIWTEGTVAEAYINIAPARERKRRLILNLTTLVKKGFQRIVVAINGEERCAQTYSASYDVTMECELPARVEGPTALSISTSYASSPREWGADDSRLLGVGLRSLLIE
jgi:hypothetical protein